MSLFTRINQAVESRIMGLGEWDQLLDRQWYGKPSASGQYVNVDNALTVPTVWACVQAISQSIASNPCHLLKTLPQGGHSLIDDHRVARILESPNDEQTPMEFWETLISHRLLWGNGYAQIVRDGYGPRELWILDPAQMTVRRNKETNDLEYIYGKNPSTALTFQFGEMFHLRGRSLNGTTGLSVIAQARETIGQALAISQYGSSFFGNGSTPGGFLSTPSKISPEAALRLKEDWENAHRGNGNAHRVAVLQGDLTWTQVTIPPDDAQFIQSSRVTKEDICTIFGVPQHKAGLLGSSSRVTIEEQELEWVTDTLRPESVRIEQAIQRDLIAISDGKRGVYAKFDLRALLRGNLTAQAAWFVQGRQWGWFNVDEIREEIGLNPLPDGLGKIYIQPLNMAPAGTNAAEPEAEPLGVPDDGIDDPPADVQQPPKSNNSTNGHGINLRDLVTVANGRHGS